MNKFFKSLLAFLVVFSATAGTPKKDIVDTAVAAGQFSTLVTAVQAAGLEETLRSKGPFTVFAPTDRAFEKLPEGTVEYLIENIDELKNILLYHVANGKAFARDVVQLHRVATIQGQDVRITFNNHGLFLNDSKVLLADIKASNGVIHVIDTVLMPQADH